MSDFLTAEIARIGNKTRLTLFVDGKIVHVAGAVGESHDKGDDLRDALAKLAIPLSKDTA